MQNIDIIISAERDQVGVGAARQGQGHQQGEQAQNRLLRPGEGQHGQKVKDDRRHKQEEQAEKPGKNILAGANILPKARCASSFTPAHAAIG